MLSSQEKETIITLVKEGILLSAGKLGKMSSTSWDVIYSSVNETGIDELLAEAAQSGQVHVLTRLSSTSETPLEFLTLFPEASGRALTQAVTAAYEEPLQAVRDLMEFTIGEVSNMLAQRVVSVMADELGTTILLGRPEVNAGPRGELLTPVLKSFKGGEKFLLTSRIELFSEGMMTECGLIIALNPRVMRRLIQAV